jgi:probable phosphoglycerate mutase
LLLDVIRHGLTPSNLGHRFNDSPDEPLTEEAHAAMRTISVEAADYDSVYVSSMTRALQTAEGLGLRRVIIDPRLCERGLGVFQGLTAMECRERHGDAFARFLAYDAEFCIPEGESRRDHLARVLSWLEAAASSGARRVLAITHGGTIDFLYRMAVGHPLHGGGTIFGSENLNRSSFQVDWPQVTLVRFDEPLTGLYRQVLTSSPP